MASRGLSFIGFGFILLFLIIGGLVSMLFPDQYKSFIIITFVVIGIILFIFIVFFGGPIYKHLKEKPFKGEEKYLICPECNIQVEKASGVCPKCGKNLLYSSEIKGE